MLMSTNMSPNAKIAMPLDRHSSDGRAECRRKGSIAEVLVVAYTVASPDSFVFGHNHVSGPSSLIYGINHMEQQLCMLRWTFV